MIDITPQFIRDYLEAQPDDTTFRTLDPYV